MILVLGLSLILNSVLADLDWRTELWMSEPLDQAGCGSCYGFASESILEVYAYRITGKKISFSPQFYVDCFTRNGCAGGSLKSTFEYVEEYQYQAYLEDYHFTGMHDHSVCVNGGWFNRTARNALADVWLLKFQKIGATEADLRRALDHGPTAHDMVVSSSVFDWDDKSDTVAIKDDKCKADPNPHSWSMVGYTDDAYIIKGSYGPKWAGNGYALYSRDNLGCGYTKKAYFAVMAKRKELEYKLGKGSLKYDDAAKYCEALDKVTGKTGWTLAIMPTRMHVYEVYDMYVKKYGADKKSNPKFNYFWIGINQAMSPEDEMTFIDGKTPVVFRWFAQNPTKKFIKMAKYNRGKNPQSRGKWHSESKNVALRFVCSRFRSEKCERISQTQVDKADKVTFYDKQGLETLEIDAGTKAVFKCLPGKARKGPTVTTCGKNGKWSKFPLCV